MLSHIENELSDITEITVDTVDRLIKRGEILESVVDKTEKLAASSLELRWSLQRRLGYFHTLSRLFCWPLGICRWVKKYIQFLFPREDEIVEYITRQEVERIDRNSRENGVEKKIF